MTAGPGAEGMHDDVAVIGRCHSTAKVDPLAGKAGVVAPEARIQQVPVHKSGTPACSPRGASTYSA